jgi:general L-amino acid transport system substrate-binding protein
MKLVIGILVLLFSFVHDARAADHGLRFIKTRGKVLCGTDLRGGVRAYQDEDGFWKGIDVDLCKAFSHAIFGRNDTFEMVHVDNDRVENALSRNRIDIMFGHIPYTPRIDLGKKITSAALLYYDRQVLLVRRIPNANSMEDYRGRRICVVNASEYQANMQEYDNRYRLGLNFLVFPNEVRAREAFFLNRCDILTGGEVYLKGLMKKQFVDPEQIWLTDETIAMKPVYAFTETSNTTLNGIVRWVINALKMAEQKGITSQNVRIFLSDKDISVRNLLGVDATLWKRFDLKPDWVITAVTDIGNYREIYDRNLGKNSDLELDIKENKLIRDGGLIDQRPFI